jgi:hypothetical protein
MEKVCGLYVHKSSIFCCILDENGEKILEQCFGTLTPDLLSLREVLLTHGCNTNPLSYYLK